MPAKAAEKSRPLETWTSSSEDDVQTPSSFSPNETSSLSNDAHQFHMCEFEQSAFDRDAIVMSGVSGRFPEADNVAEFAQHLFAKHDMVTVDDRRWQPGIYNLPQRHGKLKNWQKFDAQFFGVPPKQANVMDPQLRTLLHVAYETLLDSGHNPQKLRGSRTGVFVGSSGSETIAALTSDPELVPAYAMNGCAQSMFANRLSFALDFRGPSFAVDTACNSSLLAFQLAVTAMRAGHCDAALVCGANATLTPTNALMFSRLGVTNPRGECRSFDADGDGYARSEAIGAIFLQRASAARRIYATVVHAKSSTDGYKEHGITFPSGERQAMLLREVYGEAGVDPNKVAYMEAHGTGTKVGDPQEANAITDIFCTDRTTPLLMGSVKSNMGHAEPASGVASVAKVPAGGPTPMYREAGVDPNKVAYMEAHGTGTKVGDPQEANAITDIFCTDRTTPLLMGSVKSNMGHAEPASGVASVAKVPAGGPTPVYREAGVDPNKVAYMEAHGTGTKVGDPQEANAITDIFCTDRTTPLLMGSVKSNMGHAEPASGVASVAKGDQPPYREAVVDPNKVAYMEVHGTGTKVGDPQEANAITDIFCTDRTTPLLMGSVKSNMGHAEPASGVASVAKVIIAMETGYIPPNLHMEHPNPAIPALFDGRIEVVTEKRAWPGGLVGINSFGFGGANTHVLVKSNNLDLHSDDMHPDESMTPSRLLCYSGRTVDAVNKVLEAAERHARDAYFHALLAEQSNTPLNLFPARGFTLFGPDGAEPVRDVQKLTTNETPPVWFIFSGMGTQWNGMGKDMMQIDLFKQSILRSSEAIRHLGLDPYSIIMKADKEAFKNVRNAIVCNTAIQLALTDILKRVGIHPDAFIGHSTGEIACGYCDGGLTQDQAIQIAYYRGETILNANFPKGAMAAVGLTWEQAKSRLPEGVVAACHNGKESVSISGEEEKVAEFVEKLKTEGIFAKMVDSSGVAFHSHFMQQIHPQLLQRFSSVIGAPQTRSKRWVSSSFGEAEWNEPAAGSCSAAYHAHNVVSPVLFYDALQKIPEDAVTVEVAPHALLQAVLRRNLAATCTNVGLMKAEAKDNAAVLLRALGRIYQAGVAVEAHTLYPAVCYPVPRGTPMISPLIGWDYSKDWPVISMKNFSYGNAGAGAAFVFDPFSTETTEHKFLLDHVIDGRALFPFTGFPVMAWMALAKARSLDFQSTPVLFDDIKVFRATLLTKAVKFEVKLYEGSGNFEVMEGGTVAASGHVSVLEDDRKPFYERLVAPERDEREIVLEAEDVYKELLIRGYDYGPQFRGIRQMSNSGGRGLIKWTGNWITFLDTLLQTFILPARADSLRLPVRLRYLRIDPRLHAAAEHVQLVNGETKNSAAFLDESPEKGGVSIIEMRSHLESKGIVCGGVEMRDLTAQTAPRRLNTYNLFLEKVKFVKYYDENCFEDMEGASHDLQRYVELCKHMVYNGFKNLRESYLQAFTNGSLISHALTQMSPVAELDNEYHNKCLHDTSCTLLQLFESIFTVAANSDSHMVTVANMINAAQHSLHEDKLWEASWTQRPGKALVDLAVENTAGHLERCCLVEASSVHCINRIHHWQTSHPLIDADWVLLGPDVDSVEIPEDADITTVQLNVELGDEPSDEHASFDLLVLDRLLSQKLDIPRYLQQIKQLMRDDGFVLVCEVTKNFEIALAVEALNGKFAAAPGDGSRIYGMFLEHNQWMETFANAGFHVVSYQTDPSMITTLYLLHKIPVAKREPVFVPMDDIDEFSWVENLQKVISDKENQVPTKTFWLTSTEVKDNGCTGLGLCLREESGVFSRYRVIHDISLRSRDRLDLNSAKVQQQIQQDLHQNCYRDGNWGSIRVFPVTEDKLHERKETEHAFINNLIPGDLSSLSWVESSNQYHNYQPSDDGELCAVYYSALNFRDIMVATGRLSADALPGKHHHDKDCVLGTEFAGRSCENGRRIMGTMYGQALATTVVADRRLCFTIPEKWTMEQAASVPVVYLTAYYALIVRGKMKRRETVLIHSGSGGVGQAAIAIALSYDCEVFTTVSNNEKKDFLKKRFPTLRDRHFSNTRTTEFEYHIQEQTGGRGVDIVLNSLAEEKLQASVRCLGNFGRFLEIGKFDMANNSKLGLEIFLKNCEFHGVVLDAMEDFQEIWQLFQDGIDKGVVQPLHRTVFQSDQVEDAFRYMAQGRHIGKVLVQIRPEDYGHAIPRPVKVQAVKRTQCHPRHVYLITGGLGGFGLELATWLISRGANKLVLTSRSGVKTAYQARCLEQWLNNGILVNVSKLDISDESQAEQLILECLSYGELGGVFHLAMVLRDCLFEDQNAENFKASAAAKYWGTKNLDKVTRKFCSDNLKWFVAFSSISSGRGNKGQTNYGWANCTMERTMERRSADGLPGVAIQWGAIGDVGVILQNMGDNQTVVGGTMPQRIPSCLQALDVFLSWNYSIASSFIRAETSKSRAHNAHGNIVETVAHIMGVSDVAHLDHNAHLVDLGLDSLMGMEIKQAVERDANIILSVKEIRSLTLNKLKKLASGQVDSKKKEEESAQQEDLEDKRLQMAQLFRIRVDVNEGLPSERLVRLNDVAEGRPVFFVHTIEGIAAPLRVLAAQLAAPAFCFQCTPDTPLDSLSAMAAAYIHEMEKEQPEGPYCLVGYSYGAGVAFEMALMLQKRHPDRPDVVRSLVLMEGSHEYMQMYKKLYRDVYGFAGDDLLGHPAFETELLSSLTARFGGDRYDDDECRRRMADAADWDARLAIATAVVMDTGLFHHAETFLWVCEGVRRRFIAADRYHPEGQFQGDITLVKAEFGTGKGTDVGYDYGLEQATTGSVDVHVVGADHEGIVQPPAAATTASIIRTVTQSPPPQ